jgi:hypothetical protein
MAVPISAFPLRGPPARTTSPSSPPCLAPGATLLPCRVKFRDNEDLQTLDSNRQSGGERSVSTILYLIALQVRVGSCCASALCFIFHTILCRC